MCTNLFDIYMYICTYVYIYIHTYRSLFSLFFDMPTRHRAKKSGEKLIFIYLEEHTYVFCIDMSSSGTSCLFRNCHTYIYLYILVCKHIYIHTQIHIYTYIYRYVYIHIYLYAFTHMYTHISTLINTCTHGLFIHVLYTYEVI